MCLSTTTIAVGSCIQRIWAPGKFAGPKNSFVTISKSIIVRARLIELLMPCLDTLNEVQKRKRPSAPRMSKSCTARSPCWPKYLAFWRANQVNSLFSTKSLYAERLSFPSCASFGTLSKIKWLLKILTPMLEIWDYNFLSCRKTIRKQSFSKSLQAFRRAEKKSRECSNIEGSHMSQRSSAPRW